MGEAKFVLKEPKSKEPTLIYLLYSFNGTRLKYSIGEKIHPKYWNPVRQRVKEVRDFPHGVKINDRITSLSRKIRDTHKDLINEKKFPTTFRLKDELDKELFKNEYSTKKGFLKFIEELIQQSNIKPGTRKQWVHTLKKLYEFQAETKTEVEFDTINIDFYNRFVQFLIGKGYSNNTIGGYIKRVKIYMNEAINRKLTTNLDYKNRKFKVLEENVDKVYLSNDEIRAIYNLDLSNNSRLERVRDLFVIACYTGLRFSDLIQITKENIINDESQLKVKTSKTNEIVVIPLHRTVKEIFKKYNGNIPRIMSNQKMNEYLKEIATIAAIDDDIKIGITKGGVLQHNVFKKAELISSHTGRRSFATNAYLNNVPTIAIMKITGHKTERAFLRYIRITQEDNANKLAAHPFFND